MGEAGPIRRYWSTHVAFFVQARTSWLCSDLSGNQWLRISACTGHFSAVGQAFQTVKYLLSNSCVILSEILDRLFLHGMNNQREMRRKQKLGYSLKTSKLSGMNVKFYTVRTPKSVWSSMVSSRDQEKWNKLAQKSFASPVKTSSKSNTITENIYS